MIEFFLRKEFELSVDNHHFIMSEENNESCCRRGNCTSCGCDCPLSLIYTPKGFMLFVAFISLFMGYNMFIDKKISVFQASLFVVFSILMVISAFLINRKKEKTD